MIKDRWQRSNSNPKIILINPKINSWKLYYWYLFLGSKEPPLGLLYVASYLEKNLFDVKIIDGEKSNFNNLIKKINEIKPDIVGITCTTFSFYNAKKIILEIRKNHQDTLIILGGSHASSLPELSLELIPELDGCIVGDGEEPFLEIAAGKEVENINGLFWRNGKGKIIRNPERIAEKNIDKYNLNWNLIEHFPARYSPSFQSRKGNTSVALVVSRGCPYICSFCASNAIHGRSLRKHSVDFVIELMNHLSEKYGFTNFYFHDDHFTVDTKWLKEFCAKLIENKYGFTWACATRVESLSNEILDLMKKSGCTQVGVGVESGSDEMLSKMNKHIYAEKLIQSIERINRCGINVKGYFIIGIPGEKFSDLLSSFKMIFKVEFQHIQILYFTPLPGSSSYYDSPVAPNKWNKLNLLYPIYGNFINRIALRSIEILLYFSAYTKRFLKSAIKFQ